MMSSLIIHHFQPRGRRGRLQVNRKNLSTFLISLTSHTLHSLEDLEHLIHSQERFRLALAVSTPSPTRNQRNEKWARNVAKNRAEIRRFLCALLSLYSYSTPTLTKFQSSTWNKRLSVGGKEFSLRWMAGEIFPSSVSEWMDEVNARKNEKKRRTFSAAHST